MIKGHVTFTPNSFLEETIIKQAIIIFHFILNSEKLAANFLTSKTFKNFDGLLTPKILFLILQNSFHHLLNLSVLRLQSNATALPPFLLIPHNLHCLKMNHRFSLLSYRQKL